MNYVRPLFVIVLMLSVFLQSCVDEEYTDNMNMKEAHGDPGQIVIILDKDYWGGPLEGAIFDHFQKEIYTLPVPEPLFDLEITPNSAFIKELKAVHTIVIFEIGDTPNNRNARMEPVSKDLWAKGQIVYKLRAPNQKIATQLFNQSAHQLIDEITAFNRERLMNTYRAKPNTSVQNELMASKKISLTVPSDVTLAENKEDFVWLKRGRTEWEDGQEHEIRQGMLMYTYPYTDDSTFTIDYQIAKRDTVLKYNVPGPLQSYLDKDTSSVRKTYMKTVTIPGDGPEYTQKMIGETYVFEMRGRWAVEGDLMGGPFVSVSMFDEINSRIVTLEGYVFAPHFDKREFLRELEAMIYSFKFVK